MSVARADSGLTFQEASSVVDSLLRFESTVARRSRDISSAQYVTASVGHLDQYVQRIFPAALIPVVAFAVKAAAAGAAAEAGRRAFAAAADGRAVGLEYGLKKVLKDDLENLSVKELLRRQTA